MEYSVFEILLWNVENATAKKEWMLGDWCIVDTDENKYFY